MSAFWLNPAALRASAMRVPKPFLGGLFDDIPVFYRVSRYTSSAINRFL